MHSKTKGTTGELAVAHYLSSKGFPVFIELGDLSKTDLIFLNPKPIRVQVKSYKSNDDKVTINFKKSGPGYSFIYKESDFDLIALHVPDKNVIIWIDSNQLAQNRAMTFRFNPSKNNQQQGINNAVDYLDHPLLYQLS